MRSAKRRDRAGLCAPRMRTKSTHSNEPRKVFPVRTTKEARLDACNGHTADTEWSRSGREAEGGAGGRSSFVRCKGAGSEMRRAIGQDGIS